MKNRKNNLSLASLKATSVFIVFVSFVALLIYALYLYDTKGEFVSAFKLSHKFYLPAAAVILLSVLVYTPLSYGISRFFLSAYEGDGRFSEIFYLFKTPRLLVKVVAISSLVRVIRGALRVFALFAALIVECAVFVLCVILSGENIFDYENNLLVSVADFFVGNTFLKVFTVALWEVLICILFCVRIRFVFCKYIILENPLVGAVECLKICKYAIRGRFFKTAAFYLRFVSASLLLFVSLGKIKLLRYFRFSSFAINTVRIAINDYFGNC